jgi:hypothetical protein
MWRISTISEDWVVKGFHLHYHDVELAMRPDHRGEIVFKKVFASTSDREAHPAITSADELLKDPHWRLRFQETIDRAKPFLMGVEGKLRPLARGRLCEFHFLTIALDKLEQRNDGSH